jgi:hypothetical protein
MDPIHDQLDQMPRDSMDDILVGAIPGEAESLRPRFFYGHSSENQTEFLIKFQDFMVAAQI